jgi:hypothetical protein
LNRDIPKPQVQKTMRRREITVTKAAVIEKLLLSLPANISCSPCRKESANVNVRVTLGSISSNHAKIMQIKAKALLVCFTKFDKPFFCART